MSKITELAEEEAARVEAEAEAEPDEDEQGEDEEGTSEPEQAPDAAVTDVTPERIAKIQKQIQGEDSRHEKRLREILGDLWEGREPCPLCLQEGFVIQAPPDSFDPMQRIMVLAAMGDDGAPHLKEHPGLQRCEYCDGWGELTTGSKREGCKTEICPKCSAQGYVAKDQPSNVAHFPPPPDMNAYMPPMSGPAPNADPWGRQWGHQHWGLDPASVGA